MFGKKQNQDIDAQLRAFATAYIADKSAQAKAIIAEAIAETETKHDRAYTNGLIEMAYKLDIITMNERAALSDKLYTVELKK